MDIKEKAELFALVRAGGADAATKFKEARNKWRPRFLGVPHPGDSEEFMQELRLSAAQYWATEHALDAVEAAGAAFVRGVASALPSAAGEITISFKPEAKAESKAAEAKPAEAKAEGKAEKAKA